MKPHLEGIHWNKYHPHFAETDIQAEASVYLEFVLNE